MRKLIFILFIILPTILFSQDGISIGSGFDVGSRELIDSRGSANHYSELTTMLADTGQITYVVDSAKYYTFDGSAWAELETGGGESVWSIVNGQAVYSGAVKIGDTDTSLFEQGLIRSNNLTKQFQYYDGVEWNHEENYYEDSLFILRDSVDAIGTGFEFTFFRFRFNDTTDYVYQTWEDHATNPLYSYNNNFQYYSCKTIESSTAYTAHAMNYATVISKTLDSDAINPINIKNIDTWLGGKHGFEFPVITVASHDKDNTDVGSIYTDGTNEYKLMTVISSTQLRFMPVAREETGLLWFYDKSPNATLTWVSGGSNHNSVSVTNQSQKQYYPCTKNVSIKYYINGVDEMDNYTSAWCKFVDVVEYYEIIDPTTIEIVYPIDVTTGDVWIKVWNTYRFYNGGVVVYHRLEFAKGADVEQVGYMQPAKASAGVDSLGYIYLPWMNPVTTDGAIYDFGNIDTIHKKRVSYYFRISDLEDESKPTDRVVFLSDDYESNLDFAEACGINPDYPGMSQADRAQNDTIWLLSGSYGGKISPVLVDNERIDAGTNLSAITYKTIFDPKQITNQADIFYHNKQGSYYYIYADYVAGNTFTYDTLELPYYMNGRNISIVYTDSIQIVSGYNVKENRIIISSSFIENGKIVLRLSGNYIPYSSIVDEINKKVWLDYVEFNTRSTAPTPANIDNPVEWYDKAGNKLVSHYGVVDTLYKSIFTSGAFKAVYGEMTYKPEEDTMLIMDAMVKAIEDDDNAWSGLDGFLVFAVTNETDAMINWCDPTGIKCSKVSGPTFTKNEGYSFLAAASVVNTNRYLDNETNYSQNDAMLGIYIRTNNALNWYEMSSTGGGVYSYLVSRHSDNTMRWCINNNGTSSQQANPASDGSGCYIAGRSNATEQTMMRNKTLWTKTNSSTGLPNTPLYIGYYGNAGTDQVSVAFWGKDLTTSQKETITDQIEIYMDYLGKGVIP